MKTAVVLLILLTLFSPNLLAQDYTQWSLPEGAKARFGKGGLTGNIQYSQDGTRLAVASYIGVWLYDTETYQEIALLAGHASAVLSLAFSPDGKTLASGSHEDTVLLWDVATGKRKRTLTGHTSPIFSLAFSPDGKTLASGSIDRTIRLWDAATGEHKQTLAGHKYGIESLAFSPAGKTLASGGGGKTVRLWDVVTGEHKAIFIE